VRGVVLARAIGLAGAPITLWLVASRLRPADQGLYFVLIGVVMLTLFMEVGPGTIIVQFASHEAGRLQWTPSGLLMGAPNARAAIGVILHTALGWNARVAVVLFAVAGIGGAYFYAPRSGLLEFLVLWLSTVALVSFYVVIVPFLAVCEGTGAQVPLQRMRTVQAAAIVLATWAGLLLGHPLLACWMVAFAQMGIAGVWLVTTRRGLLQAPKALPSALAGDDDGTLAAKLADELRRSSQLWFALQFASQLVAPALLLANGGDDAARFGLTLTLTLAPAWLALGWLHARFPALGGLVASQRLREFDQLAAHAVGQTLLVFGAAALGVLFLPLLLLRVVPVLGERVLPLPATGAMLTGALTILLLQAMAAWARSFRDEAMRTPVVLTCVAMALAGIGGGVMGGASLAAVGYGAAGLLGAIPSLMLFARHRVARLRAF
jgi:hypothetical protein